MPGLLALETFGKKSFEVKKPLSSVSPSKIGALFGSGKPFIFKRKKCIYLISQPDHLGYKISMNLTNKNPTVGLNIVCWVSYRYFIWIFK